MASPDDHQSTLSAGTLILGPNGDSLASLGRIPAGENATLGHQTVFALNDSVIALGTSAVAAVELFSLSGDIRDTINLQIAPRTASLALLEAAVDQTLLAMGPSPANDRIRAMMLEVPLPDQLPFYRRIFWDGAETLWALASFPGGGETRLAGYDWATKADRLIRIDRELEVDQINGPRLPGHYLDSEGRMHILIHQTADVAGAAGSRM